MSNFGRVRSRVEFCMVRLVVDPTDPALVGHISRRSLGYTGGRSIVTSSGDGPARSERAKNSRAIATSRRVEISTSIT